MNFSNKKNFQKSNIYSDSNIICESKGKGRFPMTIAEGLILLIAVAACLYIASETLQLQIKPFWVIWAFAFPIIFTALFKMKKYASVGILTACMLFAAFILLCYNQAISSVSYLIGKIVTAVNLCYNQNYKFIYDDRFFQNDILAYTNIIMILLAFILTMLIGLCIHKVKSPLLAALPFVPFVFMAMNFCDNPLELPLLLILLCFFAIAAIEIYTNRFQSPHSNKHDNNVKYAIVTGSCNSATAIGTVVVYSLLAIAITMIAFPKNEYTVQQQSHEWLSNIVYKANDFLVKHFDIDGLPSISSGGVGGGTLGAVDKIVYKNELHLKVKTEQKVPMYLKGYVGSFYYNNAWHDVTGAEQVRASKLFEDMKQLGVSPQNIGADFNEFALMQQQSSSPAVIKNDMAIEVAKANPNLYYLPYHLKENFGDYSDTSINNKDSAKKPYKVTSYLHNTLNLDDSDNYIFTQSESSFPLYRDSIWNDYNSRMSALNPNNMIAQKDYSKFVNEVYTLLPANGTTKSIKYMVDLWHKMPSESSIGESVNFVKSFISQQASYSLSPGKTPKDKDFVEYFLFENHKGYCMHFATAATIMLRAKGIPTRYVEGYVITQQDYDNAIAQKTDTIQIHDTNAHAWIEIYQPYIGWVPYEVTPGYDSDSVAIDNMQKLPAAPPIEEIAGEVDEPIAEKVSSDVPVSSDSSAQAQPSSTATASSDTTTTVVESKNSTLTNIFLWGILIVLTIVIAVLVLMLLQKYSLRKRKAAFEQEDKNLAAIAIYVYLEKLIKFASKSKSRDFVLTEDAISMFSVSIEDFRKIKSIAEKAKFSQHKISAAELEEISSFVENVRIILYESSSKIERFSTYMQVYR